MNSWLIINLLIKKQKLSKKISLNFVKLFLKKLESNFGLLIKKNNETLNL
jgi:hypothetical protein